MADRFHFDKKSSLILSVWLTASNNINQFFIYLLVWSILLVDPIGAPIFMEKIKIFLNLISKPQLFNLNWCFKTDFGTLLTEKIDFSKDFFFVFNFFRKIASDLQ